MRSNLENSAFQQYIIGTEKGSNISLAKIRTMLDTNQQAKIVDVQGQPDNPSLLVVLLTPERAEQLKEQFKGQLIIEIDATLHPF